MIICWWLISWLVAALVCIKVGIPVTTEWIMLNISNDTSPPFKHTNLDFCSDIWGMHSYCSVPVCVCSFAFVKTLFGLNQRSKDAQGEYLNTTSLALLFSLSRRTKSKSPNQRQSLIIINTGQGTAWSRQLIPDPPLIRLSIMSDLCMAAKLMN